MHTLKFAQVVNATFFAEDRLLADKYVPVENALEPGVPPRFAFRIALLGDVICVAVPNNVSKFVEAEVARCSASVVSINVSKAAQEAIAN